MDTTSKRVGAAIRAARESKGLSQERFAEQLGTSRRHVMRWEAGRCIPGPRFRARIRELTGAGDLLAAEDGGEEDGQVAVTLHLSTDMLADLLGRARDARLARVEEALERLGALA